jgi:hypothetical protein
MDRQPLTIGPLGEHDGLSFVNRSLACVGSLAHMDRVHEYGHVTEHVELMTRVSTERIAEPSCSPAAHRSPADLYSSNELNHCAPSTTVASGAKHANLSSHRPSRNAATSRSYASRTSLSIALPPRSDSGAILNCER